MPGYGVVFTSEEAERIREHVARLGFRYPKDWIKVLVLRELEAWDLFQEEMAAQKAAEVSHPAGTKGA
jgi:hypothetical protein